MKQFIVLAIALFSINAQANVEIAEYQFGYRDYTVHRSSPPACQQPEISSSHSGV